METSTPATGPTPAPTSIFNCVSGASPAVTGWSPAYLSRSGALPAGHLERVQQEARPVPVYRSKARRNTVRIQLDQVELDDLPHDWLQRLSQQLADQLNCRLVNVCVRDRRHEAMLLDTLPAWGSPSPAVTAPGTPDLLDLSAPGIQLSRPVVPQYVSQLFEQQNTQSAASASSLPLKHQTPPQPLSAPPEPIEAAAGMRPSALQSLLWGFPDPEMEARHRAALHRASSQNISLLVLAIAALVLVETLKVITSGESRLGALPFLVSACGNYVVDRIRLKHPHVYNTHIEAWPLLLLVTRTVALFWIAAGLPCRSGMTALLSNGFGLFSVLTVHVAIPAICVRTRLRLSLVTWAITALGLWLMALRLGPCSLGGLMLKHGLPCLLGLALSLWHDYRGRCVLMQRADKKREL